MDVLMPQLGETVAEGKITEWFKQPGDAVKAGENLFIIETDKVSMEIQAVAAGTLAEIRVQAGEVAPVGTVVAVISDGKGGTASPQPATPAAPAAPKPAPKPAAAAPAPVPTPRPSGPVQLDPYFEVRTPERNFGPAQIGGRAVTPLARRLAAEAGIDLSRVKGSGPHGRIVAADVQQAGAGARTAGPALAAGPSTEQVKALYRDVPYEEVPLDGMRKTIATRLVQAKQTIPHFYLTVDLDIGQLLKLREEANASAPRDKDGNPAFKLSVNDFVIKAWAAALQRVPAANAVWAEDRILRFQRADVAVAVAIDGGLITPVIRAADTKRLSAISAEMKDLAARARDRKLKPDEYQGGSSAISNLGMYGVREFSAIINPPHATILAVGGARRQAVETKDGGIAFASLMTVTLSCDHRVVDGALGAELLAAFREIVEKPIAALV
ncbi:MAG: pyruvate dehydrogenase complex dihydrolipoamide acetyltransferase [Bradyrhizobiaceae bacterium]|nr:pyruvate dehydrogenase complex dihydrolipoamide acetyltransferase [Bradyrhizobiaceae bacterium]